MRIIELSTAIAACLCSFGVAGAADGPAWIRDFEAGRKQAAQRKGDLFLLLTGHHWCYACELLDREVLQQTDFIQATEKSFVFVELDFTFGESKEEQRRQEHYERIQREHLGQGVPMILLMDFQGRPYAVISGYKSGSGPKSLLSQIERGLGARDARDREFAAAGRLQGRERAARLHAGLQAVAPLLGSLDERGDDPILKFYPTVIAEIRRLDPGEAGSLQAIYDARQKQRDEWLAGNEAIFGKLNEFSKAKQHKAAIEFIDGVLQDVKDREVRWRLEMARQVYLEWDEQYSAALANARRLLVLPDLSPRERERLLDRESYNLWNLKRFDEALVQHERRIREAGNSPEKRLKHLENRAQMALTRPGVGASHQVKAWSEYREATKPGTDDWLTATMFLAVVLQKDGRNREALVLQREFLEKDATNPWIRLHAAESHIALEETDAARRMLRSAEQALPADPVRQGDKDVAKKVRAGITVLEEKLPKSP